MVNKEKLIFNNVLELVGNTPLVKLNVVTSGFPGTYIAKLDSFKETFGCPMTFNNHQTRGLE